MISRLVLKVIANLLAGFKEHLSPPHHKIKIIIIIIKEG